MTFLEWFRELRSTSPELMRKTGAEQMELAWNAARAEERAECVQEFREIAQKWLDAYPTSMFGLVTDVEREVHGNLITRNSAAMGRHMATQLLKQIGELKSQSRE